MGHTREIWAFPEFNMANGSPHPFTNLPWQLLASINSISGVRGMAMDMTYYPGPTAEGTDAGITLSGVTGVATVTRTAANNTGGTIRLTTGAALDANANLEIPLQLGVVTDQELWCFARLAVSDADDMDMHFGLGTPGTTDWVAALPAEGLFFVLTEGAATVDFVRRDASTSTEQASDLVTLADDTFVILGFHRNTAGVLTPYSGTNAFNLTASTASNSTTNLPDDAADELSLFFNVETGASQADYVEVDWVIAAQTETIDSSAT